MVSVRADITPQPTLAVSLFGSLSSAIYGEGFSFELQELGSNVQKIREYSKIPKHFEKRVEGKFSDSKIVNTEDGH